ncbi:hypothetical protein RCCS2_02945 [Roseobacter sp. CCS2]|nr:hypothetical protein RCCS2_02945 [Roseobacter sp. CCS2]
MSCLFGLMNMVTRIYAPCVAGVCSKRKVL